ncbi:MAG: hypothetical protein ABEH61_00650 [Haloarculaceae archaeon]
MVAFETLTCGNCGDAFRAHPSANAADNGYCSPRCESEGRGL